MSVHGPIVKRCLLQPLRVAAVDDHRTWRAGEILLGALNLATELDRVSRSRTIGVMLPTGATFPIAALAAWFLGRVVVPLNYLLKEEELNYVVRHCGCDTIVTAEGLLDFMKFSPRGARLLPLEKAPLKRMPEPRWPARAADNDLAVLLYTSGTSGRPKGVMLTHGNLRANIQQIQDWVHFDANDILCGVLPQFHSFGFTVLTLLPLTVGCKVIYSARFVPTRIVKLVREHRPSALIAIPSMYGALLSVKDAAPGDFDSVRLLVSGGEPLPQTVYERFLERFGKRISEGYGLTETAPVTHWSRPHEFRRGTVGRSLPRVDTRIVSLESNRVLGPHEEGEIRMKGPNIMVGYFKDDASTQAAFDEAGYFRTGDIGRIDSEGHLSITGRHKEMLIIGGENVFPREIEEALNRHPAVKASGVVGAPDPIRGEEPVAFVELNDGATFNEAELRAWCRTQIAAYKTPRRVIQLDQLPRSATGKILRRELKQSIPAT